MKGPEKRTRGPLVRETEWRWAYADAMIAARESGEAQ